MATSDLMRTQLADLKSKNNKVKYLLGGMIYDLYKASSVRFLYSTDSAEEQKSVKKIFALLDDVNERIAKLKQTTDEAEDASQEISIVQRPILPDSTETKDFNISREDVLGELKPVQKTDDVKDDVAGETEERLEREPETDPKSRYLRGLNDPDSSVKASAIKELSKLLGQDSVPFIKPLLEDMDPHVRGMAVTCLGIHGGEEGVVAIEKIRHDTDAYVKKCFEELFVIMPESSSDTPAIAGIKTRTNESKPKGAKTSQKITVKKTSGNKKTDGKKNR